MALVDISTDALRSPKVRQLQTADAPGFAAQQEVAEALLGVSAVFVGRLNAQQLLRASHAVTLQMNLQVEQGLDPFVVASESAGQQAESVTYRDVSVHPQAIDIMNQILADTKQESNIVQQFKAIPSVRSARTRGSGVVPTKTYFPGGDGNRGGY